MNHSFCHRAAPPLVACLFSVLTTVACGVDGDAAEDESVSQVGCPSYDRFQDYCEAAASLPAATQATVDALLAKVQTRDCAIAQVKLDELTSLEFFGSGPPVGDLAPLATLSHLTSLVLAKQQLDDLRPLARLVNLESLSIIENDALTARPFAACPILFPDTDQWGPRARLDIRPLARLKRLATLRLRSAIVRDLRPLARLEKLREVDLDCLDFGGDLAPLALLAELATLDLARGSVHDLSPIPSFAASDSGFRLLLGGSPIESLRPLALLPALTLSPGDLDRLPIVPDEAHCPTLLPGMRSDIKIACLHRNGVTPATAAVWLSTILKRSVTEEEARTMKQLDLSGRALDAIDVPFLQGLPALELLDLSHSRSTSTSSDRTFAWVVLADSSAKKPLPKVRELRLGDTMIGSLRGLGRLSFIERVDLRDNLLETAGECADLFPKAIELLLAGNPIRKDEDACPTQSRLAPLNAFCIAYLATP